MAHRARLDVPASILQAVTGWIARHRRRPGARPWQRAATVHAQVLLVLRWLRHSADLHTLARDTGDQVGMRRWRSFQRPSLVSLSAYRASGTAETLAPRLVRWREAVGGA